MTKKELRRKCCVCGKVSFHADTYGTRVSEKAKKEYRGKWVEYKCINKIY